MDKKDDIKLKSITISGFKSFDNEEHRIEFGEFRAKKNAKIIYTLNI